MQKSLLMMKILKKHILVNNTHKISKQGGVLRLAAPLEAVWGRTRFGIINKKIIK